MGLLVDTHCHLDFDRFDDDRDEVVKRAAEAGVTRIIVPGIDLASSRRVVELTEQYEGVFAAVGVHPNSTAGWQDEGIKTLRKLAEQPKVVAIGEIGLDYYRDSSPRPVQQRAFLLQLQLAAEVGKPVIIHNRESDEDVIRMLAGSPLVGRERPGVLHSFAAGWETAAAALEMGFYLGFTGPVTYKSADGLRQLVKRVPLDRLLVETDAPFLAPQRYRGKRNEPAYVRLVAEMIAEVHRLSLDEVAEQTTSNALRLFGRLEIGDLVARQP